MGSAAGAINEEGVNLSHALFSETRRGCVIANKRIFYGLWEQGLLGNKPRSWKSLHEFHQSGYRGKVHFRYASPASPFRLADVPYEQIEEKYQELVSRGARPELIRLSESIPPEYIVLHAQVARSHNHYDIDYATRDDTLRDSRGMPEYHRFATGLMARTLLEHYLSPGSLDDLNDLFEMFPDSVIEFTVYDRNVGILHGRNACVWEVRNY